MKRMPARPDLGHLKKQAKELLALYRSNDPAATARFREALPAAASKSDSAIAALGLRLHDAQSCIAREYGFPSWADLQGFVLARRAHADDPAKAVLQWLRLVYAGDIAGGTNRARPAPRLRRTAISRWRSRARARNRLATFTHAMSRSRTTTAMTTVESATCVL